MFPANLEAILFDAGGTLVHIDYAFVAEAAAGLGVAVSERALLRGEAAARRAIDASASSLGFVGDTDASRIPGYFENLLRAAGLPEETIAPVVRAMEAGHAESNLWRVPLERWLIARYIYPGWVMKFCLLNKNISGHINKHWPRSSTTSQVKRLLNCPG